MAGVDGNVIQHFQKPIYIDTIKYCALPRICHFGEFIFEKSSQGRKRGFRPKGVLYRLIYIHVSSKYPKNS